MGITGGKIDIRANYTDISKLKTSNDILFISFIFSYMSLSSMATQQFSEIEKKALLKKREVIGLMSMLQTL